MATLPTRAQYTGAMFINAKKTKENQPDYKGQVEIQGRKFWISGWCNTSTGGKQYQRLVLEDFTDEDYRKSDEIEAQRRQAAEQQQAQANNSWGRPQQGTGQMEQINQMAAPVKPVAATPVANNANTAQVAGQAPQMMTDPTMDFDDDIPFDHVPY